MPARIYKFLILILFGIFFWGFGISSVSAALIDINTATLAELDSLPHVGTSTAQSIIDNRPYATVEEIERADNIGGPGTTYYEDIIGLITVGSPAISNPNEDIDEVTQEGNKTQVSSVPTYSELKPAAPIRINIGKDRTESVESPVSFRAEVNLNKIQNGDFRWNFGDGLEGYGREVIHIYEYPGDYVVVLSLGSLGGESARINIKVTEQELTIASANPEKIEIKNNSKYDANLFGKVLVVGDRSFVFPQGTIIKSGAAISFSSKVTGLYPTIPEAVKIFSLGTTEHPKFDKKIEEEKAQKIAYLENQIASLRQKIVNISPQPNLAVKPPDKPPREEVPAGFEPQAAAAIKSGWFATLKKFFLGAR